MFAFNSGTEYIEGDRGYFRSPSLLAPQVRANGVSGDADFQTSAVVKEKEE